MIDYYDWPGGREAMIRFGPDTGPVVVAALPLFEEANRTRTFVVSILRGLAARGIASVLPDLPGTGESLVPTEQTTLLRMREAMEGAVERLAEQGRTYAIGVRSGALLDLLGLFFGRWHLAPVDGEELMRDLVRIALAGGSIRAGDDLYSLIGSAKPVSVAGNLLSSEMAASLASAILYDAPGVPKRTIRLQSDPKPADLKLPGSSLWRRAEPGNDLALAALLADDIARWVRACEG